VLPNKKSERQEEELKWMTSNKRGSSAKKEFLLCFGQEILFRPKKTIGKSGMTSADESVSDS